jgi:hypothetical protein
MDTIPKPVSDFIISLFQAWFPAAAKDPAMTATAMGFIIGCFLTWLIYRWVHEAKIDGLQAKIDGLTERNITANEWIKHKDEELQKLKGAPIGSITSLNEEKQNDLSLELKPFFRKEPSNPCISVVGIIVTNNSDKHLAHCSLRIENVKGSDPSISCAIFSYSKLRKPSPLETVFQLPARDHKNIPVAQFDSVSSDLENLGIELLCYSTQGYSAINGQQSYVVTLVGTTEIGIPVKRNYKLWIEGDSFLSRKLCIQEMAIAD